MSEDTGDTYALRLQAIADTTQEVFVLLDSDGRIEYVNAALKRVLGYEPRALLGRPLHETLAPAEHMDAIRAGYEGFRRTGTGPVVGRVHELEAVHADGHRVPVELSVSALWLDGEWHAVGVMRDISARRHVEQALRTEREHNDARARLEATVFNATSDGVLITDGDEHIEAVNRAFTQITGYPEDEVLGRTPSFLKSGRQDAAFYREMREELETVGEWNGELVNRRRDGSIYPQWTRINAVRDPQGRVRHYVAVFSDLTDLRASQERIERLVHRDPVTDLPNRLLFRTRLEQVLAAQGRRGDGAAVLHLGLDGFKHVNESLGHRFGDRLLRAMGERLYSLIRPTETLARLGGDEFGILVDGEERAMLLAEALLRQVAQTLELDGETLFLTTSVGIACSPRDGHDVESLMRNAAAAVHEAKAAGGNAWRGYSREQTTLATDRVRLTGRLREALDADELVLHYQPQVSLADGRIIGVEALVRWQHPESGLIPPDRFIPVAEQSGLIAALGEQVLQKACRQAREWRDNGVDFGHVAVNISPAQIRRSTVAAQVSGALEKSGLPPHCLQAEITESIAMDRRGEAPAFLQAMQELGVRLAMDDFGTGYSSLGYLRDLPFDTLKVDRVFVKSLPDSASDAAIAEAICTLGCRLGLEVLAEGVETPAQADTLRGFGCTSAQGFLFSRPVPAEQLLATLRQLSGPAPQESRGTHDD
ncbi:bifunctional diguanylate cyclase/phosphodiesterase [Thioalkalivibrio sp. ALE19]|uniref:putative bifunctional diguanylate cyclase/phosphodiesterase n=1 Tax=Thioalkalivibrio sp. ALE19 TaxID=1266909 RepID=UPI00041892B9|nr:EAL domain-containing protein [Thioalkalivibrio sp. ALE19]